jgi:arylsulfatase A-like enzyme
VTHQPNFLFIISEQLRADEVGLAGRTGTPHLRALARSGTVFTDAHVQHTDCVASCIALLTGRYPHATGHRHSYAQLREDDPNLLRLLRENGYHVGWLGDEISLLSPEAAKVSLDACDAVARPPRGGRIRRNHDQAVTRAAERWLGASQPRPWTLVVSFREPHAAAPLRDFEEPPAATYRGLTARMDHHVGRVLAALGHSSHAADTIVVFLSDHGAYLGEFGLSGTWPAGLHPCVTRTPLIISGPGLPAEQERSTPVEVIDVLPTVLDLAGIRGAYRHSGRSLLPMIDEVSAPHRPYAITEGGYLADEVPNGAPRQARVGAHSRRPADADLVGRAFALRTSDWTYVWRLYGAAELYDRGADPQESENVIDRARAVASELQQELLLWMVENAMSAGTCDDADGPRLGLSLAGSNRPTRTAPVSAR